LSEGGITRRQLLVGGVGAAGGLLAAGIVPAVLLGAPQRGLAQLTQAMFAAQVGTTFKIAGWPATLASVAPFLPPAAGAPVRGEAFTLVFTGPPGLKAGIHDLQHPKLGRFQLHLDEQLRAVFNRQLP
jgi:hypothetical protein